ncbi:hypothetical protein EDEG_02439 [Edhazardia aedis USNM 41457]|uniref:Uncharacterized protein n=1 Tax=Edhazardia aedis (strain USNM 41457) TaxID=1003232 RepID=J9D5X7_EDHAE|nr:hypothetical protein EDEG_02439 [Edhazardia aedis USNM 41457]|eukprot:EJW03186.1 hypothetical protein EDEG_02439 [Edhazardia aedis USNM 41457]
MDGNKNQEKAKINRKPAHEVEKGLKLDILGFSENFIKNYGSLAKFKQESGFFKSEQKINDDMEEYSDNKKLFDSLDNEIIENDDFFILKGGMCDDKPFSDNLKNYREIGSRAGRIKSFEKRLENKRRSGKCFCRKRKKLTKIVTNIVDQYLKNKYGFQSIADGKEMDDEGAK